jgi:hypothetical protein
VQLLVERLQVQENALELRIRAEGLASLIGELQQQGERRRHEGQRRDLALAGSNRSCASERGPSAVAATSALPPTAARLHRRPSPQPDGTPLKALARRGNGRRCSMIACTPRPRKSSKRRAWKSCVSRILRLAQMAPDLVEAVLGRVCGSGAHAWEAGATAACGVGAAAPTGTQRRQVLEREIPR